MNDCLMLFLGWTAAVIGVAVVLFGIVYPIMMGFYYLYASWFPVASALANPNGVW